MWRGFFSVSVPGAVLVLTVMNGFCFSMAALQEDGAAAREAERWEGYVDWRNRPAVRGRHGGMLAASFVLGKYTRTSSFLSFLLSCFLSF